MGALDDRFNVFKACIDTILANKPSSFLLENVDIKCKAALTFLNTKIQDLGELYNITSKVINAIDYSPQHRKRRYYVGIRLDKMVSPDIAG